MVLRGCLLALSLWAALSYGYFVFVGEIFPEPATYIVPIVVGFSTMCGLGALCNAWTAWRDLARLRRAQNGTLPRGGQVIAVSGLIHPAQQALPTPFRHLDCVLCEYDIQLPYASNTNPDSSPGSYFSGFMMIPCAIHTERGPVPLFGFPLVDKYVEAVCPGAAAASNASQFLRNTQFEDRSGLKIVSVMTIFSELWSDADGMIFKNMRFTKNTADDLYPLTDQVEAESVAAERLPTADDEDDADAALVTDREETFDREAEEIRSTISPRLPRLIEKYIPVGEEVTVFGVYQEMSGGIGPTSRSGKPTRLFRRSAAEQANVSRRSVISNLLGGTISLVVIHLLLLGAIWLYQHSEDGKRHQERRAKQRPAAVATIVPRGEGYH
jgi:hypothetical protein